MVGFVGDRLGRLGRFAWSGWSGLAAVALLAAVWQAGHEAYGDFILPSPMATALAAIGLLAAPENWTLLLVTMRRALSGFFLAGILGALLGVIAGYAPAVMRLSRPLLTVALGVPPIAWIVLTMIWFGASDATVAATILVSATPVVFVAGAEGVMTRDRGLDAMAEVFGAGPIRRFLSVGLRQVCAHLLPALALALGTSFKVAVMAELLANAGGVGGALARTRAMLDITGALAWVMLSVVALVVGEYGLVRPVRAELERWREAAQPWGVKR
nr:ABC transporter permease subunit [Devosia ureilytica]